MNDLKHADELEGFRIDDTCYPWFAYKGPRGAPTEHHWCYTKLESELLREKPGDDRMIPLVDQFDDGIRPAGPEDECFYCHQKVGQPHGAGCVVVYKKVTVQYIFEIEIEVPYGWDEDAIEFHRNESSWCATNGIQEIIDYSRQDDPELPPGEPGCICRAFGCEYVGETDAPPYNKTVDPAEFRKSRLR